MKNRYLTVCLVLVSGLILSRAGFCLTIPEERLPAGWKLESIFESSQDERVLASEAAGAEIKFILYYIISTDRDQALALKVFKFESEEDALKWYTLLRENSAERPFVQIQETEVVEYIIDDLDLVKQAQEILKLQGGTSDVQTAQDSP